MITLLFVFSAILGDGSSELQNRVQEYKRQIHRPDNISMRLIGRARFADEIDLLENQEQQIRELWAKYHPELRDVTIRAQREYPEYSGRVTPEQQKKNIERSAAVAAAQRPVYSRWGAELKKVLLPKQVERLHELAFQHQGVRAFFDRRIQKLLAMTETQVAAMKDIHQQLIFIPADVTYTDAEHQQRRQEAFQKALQVLNNEQRAAATVLFGKP